MTLGKLLAKFDDWNGTTRVNNSELKTIVEKRTDILAEDNSLCEKQVVSFGFDESVLTVRIAK